MGTTSVEEYVRLFRAKAEQMGEFPDKIIIGALTGTATRHRDDMSQHIVALLESMICDPNHPAKHKLPLCYLVDSIVKNITEPYVELFERGLVRWFCSAYDAVDETSKKHLARVVATWEVQSVFTPEKRKEIQRYILTGQATPPAVAPPAPAAPVPPPKTAPPPAPTAQPQPPPPPMHIQGPSIVQAPPLVQQAAPAVAAPIPPPSLVPAQAPVGASLPLPPPPPPPPPPMAAAPAVAPVTVTAVPTLPDVPSMINARMKHLLDQQLRELGEPNTMTLDDLWRTNAELAGSFRLVAQAQVHDELGLPPPPPPPSVTVTHPPAPQHPLPQPPPPLPPPAQQVAPPQPQPQPHPQLQPQPQQQPQPQPPPQQQQQQQPQPQPQPQPQHPQQLTVQLPLRAPAPAPTSAPGPAAGGSRSPPPWTMQVPPRQDFSRAVQLANEVMEEARSALDSSVHGDAAGAQVTGADAAGKAALLACLLGGEATASGEAGLHLTDLHPWDVRALARTNPASVRRLYGEGFPFWCKQDGTRFGMQIQLDAHMDLLFRRKRARRELKGDASREWYCTGEEWMTDFGRLGLPASGAGDSGTDGVGGDRTVGAGGGEDVPDDGDDIDPDGAEACVPADERYTKCRICGERFEMFYDNDEEEWMYRNACYLRVYGVDDGAGEGADEDVDDEDGDMAGGAGDDEAGDGMGDENDAEGGGRSRQIIVHKLCLEVSGLKDRDRITWRDLMPGTPRQRKRPASNAGLGSAGADEEGANHEDGDWAVTGAVANGGGDQDSERHVWDSTVSNGIAGDQSDGSLTGTMGAGPPHKRAKSEFRDDEIGAGVEEAAEGEQALGMM